MEKRIYGERFFNFYLENCEVPITKYTFHIGNQTFGGNGNIPSKAIILDCDGVLDRKEDKNQSLFTRVLDNLSGFSKILRRMPDLKVCLEEITYKREFSIGVKRFAKILRQCGLKKHEYEDTCIEAAKEVKLTTNVLSFISELYKMGYIPAIISGSPKFALNLFGTERLYIYEDYIYGTLFQFDRNNCITDSVGHNLGTNKVSSKNKFLNDIYCPQMYSIIVDDDQRLEFELGASAGLGLVLWTQKGDFKKEYRKRRNERDPTIDYVNVSLECLEARNDLKKLIPLIKVRERALIEYFIRDPWSERKLISETQLLKKITDDYLKNEKEQTLALFKAKTQEILSILGPILDPSVINNLLLELKRDDRHKKLVSDIYYEMRRIIPQFKATKEYIEGVDNTIETWEREFPNLSW